MPNDSNNQVTDSDNLEIDKRVKAAYIILSQHPKLYDYLISPTFYWLRDDPEILSQKAGVFSSGEKILISVTLDLCFDYSASRLSDVINRLDSENFINVIKGIIYLRKTRL